MEVERIRTAGGIVLGDSGTIALVFSKNSGAWLFPKGHVEEDEADEDAARREIVEETGLTDLEYIEDLGLIERVRSEKNGNISSIKEIHMFLFAARPHAELAPTKTTEILKAQWVSLPNILDVLGTGEHQSWFEADRAWFTRVFERVRQAIQRD